MFKPSLVLIHFASLDVLQLVSVPFSMAVSVGVYASAASEADESQK